MTNRGFNAWRSAILGLIVMFATAQLALAHKGSDAYLDVRQLPDAVVASAGSAASVDRHGASAQDFRFVLSVALRDLDQVVAVDADADARITWGEVKRATAQLLALLDQTVRLANGATRDTSTSPAGSVSGASDRACTLRWQADGLERRSDGSYFRASATARCAPADALNLRYTLFSAQDANHRVLIAGRIATIDLLMTASPQQAQAVPLRADRHVDGTATVDAARSGRWATLQSYFLLGMHHLLQGYDHLAFLLALVLPLRMQLLLRSPQVREAMPGDGVPISNKAHWLALLRTLTAFTVGHSATLILAALGWTQASPTWVEPVIALSIIATAALNLRPVSCLRIEWLALGFGMVHGYGFAGLLQEASAPDGLLGWALVGFNLGVEAGQLLVVAVWVLLAQWLMTRRWYVAVVVRGGSVLLMGLATAWFWQRIA